MNAWTISRRLTLGFAGVVAVIITLAVVFMLTLRRIDDRITSLSTDSLPGVVISGRAVQQTLHLRVLMLMQVASSDAAEIKRLNNESEQLFAKTEETLKSYESTIFTAEDRENFQRAKTSFDAYHAANRHVRELAMENRDDEAHAFIKSTAMPAYNAFERAALTVSEWNEKSAHESAAAAVSIMGLTRRLTIVLAAGGLLIAVAAGFVITRGVNRLIRRVADSLSDGAEQVTAAAAQVSASGQTLAEGTTEQAASLEETSASLEEVSSMTKRNATSAQQAKDLSNQMRSAAEVGAADMTEMKRAMDAIKASSDAISKIIKTIDEIAFQTNILALNAAVEAARAGDAGMGFAVVADEVRSLAQRSAQSARETAEKIEEAIQKSDHGVQFSGKVGHSLGEILEKARQVDALVVEIATASQEQSQGIEQVNTAVGQMDKVTQSSASTAEETAAAAEELSAQAVAMRDNVGELMKLVGRSEVQMARPAQPAGPASSPERELAASPRRDGSRMAQGNPPKRSTARRGRAPAATAPAGLPSSGNDLAGALSAHDRFFKSTPRNEVAVNGGTH